MTSSANGNSALLSLPGIIEPRRRLVGFPPLVGLLMTPSEG